MIWTAVNGDAEVGFPRVPVRCRCAGHAGCGSDRYHVANFFSTSALLFAAKWVHPMLRTLRRPTARTPEVSIIEAVRREAVTLGEAGARVARPSPLRLRTKIFTLGHRKTFPQGFTCLGEF